jgi:hypothetical protein
MMLYMPNTSEIALPVIFELTYAIGELQAPERTPPKTTRVCVAVLQVGRSNRSALSLGTEAQSPGYVWDSQWKLTM